MSRRRTEEPKIQHARDCRIKSSGKKERKEEKLKKDETKSKTQFEL